MKGRKPADDITRIVNPTEIKHFLSFGAYFHIQSNKKTRPCKISLVDAPLLGYSGIIATLEDESSGFYDFKDINNTWQIGFTV